MSLRGKIGKNVAIYLGSAWVVVEAANFFIERYSMEPLLIDVLIIGIVFGALATIIYSAFEGRWNKMAVILQSINGTLVIATWVTFFLNPLLFNPSTLRILPLSNKESPFEGLHAIAVLPFSNFMGDDSQEYLLAGMHDGLISEMGKLENLRVISRTSSNAYKNTDKSIQAIAKELNVDAIIEASMTRVDSLVELKMKLIDVAPYETVIWDHSYSIPTNELPNLFREVTKNLAQKIEEVALPNHEKLLAPHRVPNPGAYEASLRGHHYMGLLTKEGFQLAEQQFKRAIRIDSLYAVGYSGLAAIIVAQRQMGFVNGDHIIPKVDSLMQIATSLDSTSAEMLAGLACHYTWSKFEWEKAAQLFERSIEINPNNAPTRAYYAHFLGIMGLEEAREQMEMALALDPNDPWVLGFGAAFYGGDGKLLSAVKQANKLIQLAPENPLAQQILLEKHVALNNEEKAIKQLIKILSLFDIPKIEEVAMMGFNEGGFKEGVKALVVYLETDAKDYFIRPNLMFQMHGWLDNKAKQEEWLMKMYEMSDPNLPYMVFARDDFDSKVLDLILKEIGL